MAEEPRDADLPSSPPGERDAIDPELVRLRRPAPRVGLVTSAAIVIACVTLMIRLRHDFAFARAGEEPRPVALADIIAGRVPDESYVTLAAPIERASALRVRTTEANAGTRVAAVAGSSDAVWLAVPGDAWLPAQHDEVATGRLRAMTSVRFASTVDAYLAAHPAPRHVAGTELRRARRSAPPEATAELTLVDGGHVQIQRDDPIEFLLPDPNATTLTATFSPRLPDVAAWSAALASAGVLAAGTAPARVTEDTARWNVAQPVAIVSQALDAAGLWGARAEASTAHLRSTWGQLDANTPVIRTPEGALPWDAIDVAAIWTPRAVPPGARIVLVGETPGSYWYLPPIFAGLGLFAALFTWALMLAVRRHFFDRTRRPPVPS